MFELTAGGDTFRIEAEDCLAAMEQGLDALATGEREPELVHTIFRAAHTLKGAALVVGRRDVGELAHVLEELFVRWRDARLSPNPLQISWSANAIDMLRAQLDGSANAAERSGGAAGSQQRAEAQLRVPASDVDALLSTLGELVLAHGRVNAGIARLAHGTQRELADMSDAVAPLHAALREQIMKLRLVPIATLVARLRRTTLEVARKLGKSVEFVTVGADQSLDTTLVEGLRDPFLHLLRNALDHGIETPEQRAAAGKPDAGMVTFRFRKSGDRALFELSDDGRGLDRERIAAKARERGRDVQAHELTDADLLAFIFEPGFSTAAQVTEVSGRGVGMDVVRQNIQALRGTIRLESLPGRGTTFTIELPLDVAVVEGLLVESGTQSFVLPEERVLEFVSLSVPPTAACSTIRVREQTLPCIRLGALFDAPASAERETVLVLSHAGGQIGLLVERSLGVQQTMVRPVGPLFRSFAMVAGAAVLGSGDVALLLDVDELVASCTRRWMQGSLSPKEGNI